MPIALVVHKDALVRETFTLMLEAMDYTVISVESAEEAYGVLKAFFCDFLMVGLTVDDPDGVDIAIRSKSYQPQIKVIIVSGGPRPDSLNKAIDEFVLMPFGLKDIDQTIKSMFA